MSTTSADHRVSAAPEGWVPADACTLPTAEQPLRVAEFDTLFATALRGVERSEPTRLRLRLDPQMRAEAQSLVDRESECCAFFDFQLAAIDGDLVVDVRIPSGRVDVLDGLEHQATTALSRVSS